MAGRKTKYKKAYCDELEMYFDVEATKTLTRTIIYKDGTEKEEEYEVANDLPTFIGFAHLIGVCRDTLYEWADKHKPFSDSMKKARELQERNWRICSLKGLYNPAFTIFMGKNVFKWSDRQDVSVKKEESLTVSLDPEDRKVFRDIAQAVSRKVIEKGKNE